MTQGHRKSRTQGQVIGAGNNLFKAIIKVDGRSHSQVSGSQGQSEIGQVEGGDGKVFIGQGRVPADRQGSRSCDSRRVHIKGPRTCQGQGGAGHIKGATGNRGGR